MFIFSHVYVRAQECVYIEVIAKFWASSLMDSPIYLLKMLCVNVLPVCKCMHHDCGWCSWRPDKGIASSETGITGRRALSCGGWELNLVPVKDQWVIFIAELSLSRLYTLFLSDKVTTKQGPISSSIMTAKHFLGICLCLPSQFWKTIYVPLRQLLSESWLFTMMSSSMCRERFTS